MRTIQVGKSMSRAAAAKAAEMLRRNGRKVRILAPSADDRKWYGAKKTDRRIVVTLKRGEDEYTVQKELAKKVLAQSALAMSKERRAEVVAQATATRRANSLRNKVEAMREGFRFEILRDFVLQPKHRRKQRIHEAPRKKDAFVRLDSIVGYYESVQDSEMISVRLRVIVSRNIALEVIEFYQNYEGFHMMLSKEGVVITIKPEVHPSVRSEYEELAKVYESGVYKPE